MKRTPHPKSGYVYCSVYGCMTRKKDGLVSSFFRLPTNNERRNLWLEQMGRLDLINRIPTAYRICSIHFEDSMIESIHIRKLLPDAVPTKFLPNSSDKDDQIENIVISNVTISDKLRRTRTKNSIGTQQKQPKPKGASAGNSSCNISLNPDSLGLKVSAPETPEHDQPQDLCRFCAEYSKDCVDVTNQDRPYVSRNKTALALNDLSVELDFNNDALPKTVCGICDRKLQAMYDFFKQVKDAQESLIKVNVKEEIETVIVKTECEYVMCEATPKNKDDVDEIDSKHGIIDSVTVTKTEVAKPYSNKRKSVKSTPKAQKKPKIKESKDIESEESEPETQKKPKIQSKDIKSEQCELIIDIKQEIPETVNSYEDYEAENPEDDAEIDIKPSVSGLATSDLVNEKCDNETFS